MKRDDNDVGVAGLFADDVVEAPSRRELRQAGRTGSAQASGAYRQRPPDRGRRRGLLAVTLLVTLGLFAGIIGGGVYAAHRIFTTSGPADFTGAGTGSVTVQVRHGDGAAAIGATLVDDGVVASAAAFSDAAADDPRSKKIAPGFYALSAHMKASLALARLLDPRSALRSKVTVPEGSSLSRTLALIAAKTSVPASALAQAVANPLALGLPTYAKGRVEGFLFPDTYEIEPGTQAVDALTQFTQAFKLTAARLSLEAGARTLGRTPYDIVTVASLIEGEAAKPADRPKVAEVIYNRLRRDINLGLESTVRYALGGVDTTRLLQSQLTKAKASPYDTYTHAGLPPGPIDNPGADALTAALHPAVGNDLYFVTLPATNQTVFTSSEATFEQLTAQCRAQGGC